jgi:hypothetical protein
MGGKRPFGLKKAAPIPLTEEVHRWLDEFLGQPPYGMRHRKTRYHFAGIDQARKLWGE